MTSLNLFATRFDQVLDLIDNRREELDLVLIDTPGQIEVFTWSASGQIITDSLKTHYPTVLVFVVDTPRCSRPATFLSSMLYACSMLYKARLPILVAFNKTDIASADTQREWMSDVESFHRALDVVNEQSYSPGTGE